MKKILIYDLPTRMFHWIFAGLFIAAFGIANTIDEDNLIFSYHMIIGIVMVCAVVLRLVWGLVGSRYAKLSSFELAPAKLIEYFKGIASRGGKIFAGHNPASSWAAIVMILLTLGLGLSGFLMATGTKGVKEFHEVMANLFLATVIGHVLGIILHTIRHRDPIALSMVGGEKNLEEGEAIAQSYPIVALGFVLILGVFSGFLFKNFNQSTKVLSVMGLSLQLGENEGSESEGHENGGADGKDKDRDDD